MLSRNFFPYRSVFYDISNKHFLHLKIHQENISLKLTRLIIQEKVIPYVTIMELCNFCSHILTAVECKNSWITFGFMNSIGAGDLKGEFFFFLSAVVDVFRWIVGKFFKRYCNTELQDSFITWTCIYVFILVSLLNHCHEQIFLSCSWTAIFYKKPFRNVPFMIVIICFSDVFLLVFWVYAVQHINHYFSTYAYYFFRTTGISSTDKR